MCVCFDSLLGGGVAFFFCYSGDLDHLTFYLYEASRAKACCSEHPSHDLLLVYFMRGSSFVLRCLLSCFLSRLNISIFICMQIYYNNEFIHFFFEDLLHSLLVCVCVCVCVCVRVNIRSWKVETLFCDVSSTAVCVHVCMGA